MLQTLICDFPWLAWLLSGLLGYLIGHSIWSKWKNIAGDWEGKANGLKTKVSGLEGDLAASMKVRTELDSDLSLTKGRMREIDRDLEETKKALAAAQANDKGDAASISGLNKKVSDLESQLSACKKARADMDGELSRAKADLDAANKGLASAKSDLESAKNNSSASSKDLEDQLSACKKARADLEGDLSKAKADLASAKAAASSSGGGSNAANLAAGFTAGAGAGGSGGASGSGGGSSSGSGGSASATGGGSSASSGGGSVYSNLKSDNLQVIEGVGPKMESILKENGVNSWSALAGKSTSEVQAILDKYGDKYKIIDPGTWVQQAGLAASGDWAGLVKLQKALDTGRTNATGETDAKVEKLLMKMGLIKSFKQDDLKAIEGIGPAIEKLMHAAGIKTWRDMANSSVEKLKSVLDDAGSRFKLADPGTWPKQAELAADGKFKELQEYQDFLDGGK